MQPDAKMVLLSYIATSNPPKSFDKFPDNVILELCIRKDFQKKFDDWARFRDVPKIAYVYFFGLYHSLQIAPKRSPKYIASCMRTLAENGVKSIFKCAWTDDLGLEGHIAYIFSRLLEDPMRNPYEIGDEFCDLAYGKASVPMKRFYAAMYANLDTVSGHSLIDELTSRLFDEVDRQPHNQGRIFEWAFRPYTISSMEASLLQAESTGGLSEKERARIALVRRSFSFLKARAQCYFLQEDWNVAHAPELLDVAERISAANDTMLDKWYGQDGKMIRPEGFDWHYIGDLSRERIVGGGSGMVPAFPPLFQNGPDGWRAKKARTVSGK